MLLQTFEDEMQMSHVGCHVVEVHEYIIQINLRELLYVAVISFWKVLGAFFNPNGELISSSVR